jgi:hypothetical protein
MGDARSRYAGLVPVAAVLPGGRRAAVLPLRIIPPEGAAQGAVATRQDERVDALAARAMGDPLLFWRLCDANLAGDPQHLVGAGGRRLGLPAPGG